MDKFINVIKILINNLMTLILIIGMIFIVLFIFGIEPYVVETGSMEPTIKRGSLSFINKHIKYDNINNNDIIAYILPSGSKVTHRVINITEDGFETKGDNNNLSDGISTSKDNYLGKNIISIPKVGYVVKFIQTPKGKVILFVLIIVILTGGFLLGDDKKKIEANDVENKKEE